MKKWKLKKSKIMLDEKFLKVRKDRVLLPSGKTVDWFYNDMSDSPSVLIIGVTGDKKIILIRQYRYLVGKEVLELPAGYSNKGESMSRNARRELEEETGYKCKKIRKIGIVHENYGKEKHELHIFLAAEVTKRAQHLEDEEYIKTELTDFRKAVNLAVQNKILHAASAFSILLLNEKIKRGEIKL